MFTLPGSLKIWRYTTGIALFAAAVSLAADTLIPADNPAINYYGRFDFTDPKAPRFNWSGSTIEFQVHGTATVGMEMTDGAGYYDIEIDGKVQSAPVYADSWNSAKYPLVSSLSPDPHVIRIIRRNEPYWAIATFGGIYLSEGGTVQPLEQPVRKMEFCGDSWTAGYFIEECGDQQAHTNANKSWARLTSKAFKAQDIIMAESGIGLVKSNGGKTSLPEKYAGTFDTMGGAATPLWDFSTWIPDIVSIFLGINDKGSGASDNEYSTAVHSFVTTIRGNYPNTPILFIAYKDCMDQATESAVSEETTSLGHKDVYFYRCETPVNGCSWHPDPADAREIANAVVARIKQITGWDTTTVFAGQDVQSDRVRRRLETVCSAERTFLFSTYSGMADQGMVVTTPAGKIVQRLQYNGNGACRWDASRLPEGVYMVGTPKTGWVRVLVK
jgi:lysophospholipase L1-like esterase